MDSRAVYHGIPNITDIAKAQILRLVEDPIGGGVPHRRFDWYSKYMEPRFSVGPIYIYSIEYTRGGIFRAQR